MDNRLTKGFFYGLYMDPILLASLGMRPIDPLPARIDGYRLDLHGAAKVIPATGSEVWGMVITLAEEDLWVMYSGPKTGAYRPFLVTAYPAGGGEIAARCYTLLPEPWAPLNREYLVKLVEAARRLVLPGDYLRELEAMGTTDVDGSGRSAR